jgi:hypothetical protein
MNISLFSASVSKSLLIVLGTLQFSLGRGQCRPVESRLPTGLGQPYRLPTLPTAPAPGTVVPRLFSLMLAAFSADAAGTGPRLAPAPRLPAALREKSHRIKINRCYTSASWSGKVSSKYFHNKRLT